ncbi:MAG: signal peptidase II [Candidatus Omnitrophica bacterium]|nr:signal peptidase II [Candidatus Omnitrophota bacterium]
MMIILIILIIGLDQFTKFILNNNLVLNSPYPVIKGFFYLTLVHNKGAAFGILKNQILLFILSSIFAIILIYFNLKKSRNKNKLSLNDLALGLIFSGAIGNLVDRLFLGYVVDFLDFRVWPVFNVADSAITVGAVLLGWSLLKDSRKKSAD